MSKIQEFELSANGESVYFRFQICDWKSDGLRIYLYYFPDMEYFAKTGSHEAHLYYDDYNDLFFVCWDRTITSYKDANSVMFVWAKNYLKNCYNKKRETGLKPSLPTGTFRGTKDKIKTIKNTVELSYEVIEAIYKTIGKKRAESGGMLGSSNGNIIDVYVYDKDACVGVAEYTPNTKFLNTILHGEWDSKSINLLGFIHSHPIHYNRPSYADEEYVGRIMQVFNLSTFFMPIVKSEKDSGQFQIFPYIMKLDHNGNISTFPCEMKVNGIRYNGIGLPTKLNYVTNEEEVNKINDFKVYMNILEDDDSTLTEEEIEKVFNQRTCIHKLKDTTFSRIENVINLDTMKNSLIIGLGCGGSREFYLDMARIGVSNFLLIDGDKVSKSNLSSQNVFESEVGMFKVDAIKEKILDINPEVNIKAINHYLSDDLNDEWFKTAVEEFKVDNNLITAFTDSFNAQARASRLALKYSYMFLSAQHYEKGLMSEIIYWYPGISLNCPRCYLKKRYESYLSSNYKNTVTSMGSPIFNTVSLNALCEKIATGMLLYKENPANNYSLFLIVKPDRNLLLIRQQNLFMEFIDLQKSFSNMDKQFFGDVSWLNYSDLDNHDYICYDCKGERKINIIANGIYDSRTLDNK